jgi:hypothetical protein
VTETALGCHALAPGMRRYALGVFALLAVAFVFAPGAAALPEPDVLCASIEDTASWCFHVGQCTGGHVAFRDVPFAELQDVCFICACIPMGMPL